MGSSDPREIWHTVLPIGQEYPTNAEVLAVGHIFIALAQAHHVSLIDLIQLTTSAFQVKQRQHFQHEPVEALANEVR
jgi:hypothetical protein